MSSRSERLTGMVSSSPSSTSIGSGSGPRGSAVVAVASAFTEIRRPRTAAMAPPGPPSARQTRRAPPRRRAPPPRITTETPGRVERHPKLEPVGGRRARAHSAAIETRGERGAAGPPALRRARGLPRHFPQAPPQTRRGARGRATGEKYPVCLEIQGRGEGGGVRSRPCYSRLCFLTTIFIKVI